MADAPSARTARRSVAASAVPKSRRTQAVRSGEMKRRILDAAFAVLKERGFAGFTTPEVARRELPAQISEDLLLLTVSRVRGFGIRQLWSAEPERVAGLLTLWQDMIDTYVAAKVPAKAPAAHTATPPRKRTRA